MRAALRLQCFCCKNRRTILIHSSRNDRTAYRLDCGGLPKYIINVYIFLTSNFVEFKKYQCDFKKYVSSFQSQLMTLTIKPLLNKFELWVRSVFNVKVLFFTPSSTIDYKISIVHNNLIEFLRFLQCMMYPGLIQRTVIYLHFLTLATVGICKA